MAFNCCEASFVEVQKDFVLFVSRFSKALCLWESLGVGPRALHE